ncbi:MAG: sensor histidine kinase [Lutibacter sp.]
MVRRNLVIFIFIVSVLGLVAIQYQYLRIGLNLASVQFNQNLSKSIKSIQKDLTYNNKLTFLLGKAITNDTLYFKTNIDSTRSAAKYFLNDFIDYKLLENGIKANFSYSLKVKDTTLNLVSKNYNIQEKTKGNYTVQLKGYLPNLVQNNVILKLKFNNLNRYLLSQLNGLTLPSLIFILAIIAVIFWVLKSFYWQQNIITQTNDFINNLTHELKTPVFSIGLATKMLQKTLPQKNQKLLDVITQENERLKNQIENVLQLTNIGKKRKSEKIEIFDFYPMLAKICDEFNKTSSLEQISFRSQLEKNKKYMIKGNANQLSTVIYNLLDNAKKYNDNPKIISLTSFSSSKKLHINIKDNGFGIAKKHHNLVFRKHFRISSGNLYQVKGYGLGLFYVKKILKLHKGTIKLNSELGKGTTIKLTLPLTV